MDPSLESALSSLLGKIYSTPQSFQPSPLNPQTQASIQLSPTEDADLFASDEFRMYCYKVVHCSIRGPHEWTTCVFRHPGEKAARRCPQKYNYTAIACPDMKSGECPRGENCFFAHNVFEYHLHPLRYRTQMCSYGSECRRATCFFAHQYSELRRNENLPQLQALEREIEGGETGPGFHGLSRWGSTTTKLSSSPAQRPRTTEDRAARSVQGTLTGRQVLSPSPKETLPSASQQALVQAALQTIASSPQPPGRFMMDSSYGALASIPSLPAPSSLSPSSPHVDSQLPSSLSSQDIDTQMAAAMKLIADLSATKQQIIQQQQLQKRSSAGVSGTAASPTQQQTHVMGYKDVAQCLLIPTQSVSSPVLNSYCSAPTTSGKPMASLPQALPSADEQGFMDLLPELLKRLTAGGTQLPSFLQLPPVGTAQLNDSSKAGSDSQSDGSPKPPVSRSLSGSASLMSGASISSACSEGRQSPAPSQSELFEEPSKCPAAGLPDVLLPTPLLEALSHMVYGPSTADMYEGVHELDLELQKLSMLKISSD